MGVSWHFLLSLENQRSYDSRVWKTKTDEILSWPQVFVGNRTKTTVYEMSQGKDPYDMNGKPKAIHNEVKQCRVVTDML